jgi:hypothetical protein
MVSLFVSCVGDSMPRESQVGPGVDLGIRRRPWWSEIMRDTKARVDARG